MQPLPHLLRLGARIGALAAVAAFLPAPAAQARLVQPSDCQPDPSLLASPFASVGDDTTYELVGGPYLLADGESALTAPACVNVSHPAVRFFVFGDPSATVAVSAVFATGSSSVAIPLGEVPADAGVSPALSINVVNLAALHGQNTLVTLRFSVRGGSAAIGTAWVDPWAHV